MKLIIAEKPNVAKELKEALEPNAKYFKTKGSGYYKGNKFIFACSLGHIIVQKQPKEIDEKYKTYSFDVLPLPIKPIPLRVGDKPANDYYKTLRDVIQNETYDEIIVATDPDREGQGIYERIKTYMPKFPKNILETRMWIKEWTAEGLQNAFQNRDANINHKGLGDAAECRAYDDYCIGMNGTIACTVRFNKFLTVGRVQTAVTKIIVSREEEIRNFVSQKYQALALVVGSDIPNETVVLKHQSQQKLSVAEAEALYNKLTSHTSVRVSVQNKKATKKPMKLGGQTCFLKIMNKKYGYEAKKTSDILQTLYQDKKLTTYPGTEAEEISVSAAKAALKPLQNIVGKVNSEIDALIKKVLDNGWHISNNCVTEKELAHEAITPVFGAVSAETVKSLTGPEMNCYLEIIKRYLQAFFPNAIYNETVVETTVADETFVAKGKVLVQEGFLEVEGAGEDTVIAPMTDGGTYPVFDIKNEEKETEPPKRYTVATLLEAMEHAGRFVEDKHYADILKSEKVEGIGTGRTRNVILDILKKRGYYEIKNKSIYATQTAIDLIQLLPDNIMITSPVLTAKLEEELQLVEEGKVTKEQHMSATDKMVAEMIRTIKNVTGSVATNSARDVLCQCPRCSGNIVETSWAYSCVEKCGVVIFKDDKFFASLGKKMSKDIAINLFTKHKVVVKDIVSKKTNKKYDLVVTVDFSGQWPKYSTEFLNS